MPNPVCNATTLITNAACYHRTQLNPIQQQSLLIYAKVLELAAIGGTDYRTEMTGDLLTDAACPPSHEDDITAARIAVAFANATEAGATVPADINDKLDAIACLQHVPGGANVLNRIDLLLTCKLGRAEAYPQT